MKIIENTSTVTFENGGFAGIGVRLKSSAPKGHWDRGGDWSCGPAEEWLGGFSEKGGITPRQKAELTLAGFTREELETAGLFTNFPHREKTWAMKDLEAHMAAYQPIPEGLNFANPAQRSAGLSLSASDYLHAEGLANAALLIAAENAVELATYGDAETGPSRLAAALAAADSIASDGKPIGDPAEFERLVTISQIPYETVGLAAIHPLMDWYARAGCQNIGHHIARLAAQLGWTPVGE